MAIDVERGGLRCRTKVIVDLELLFIFMDVRLRAMIVLLFFD